MKKEQPPRRLVGLLIFAVVGAVMLTGITIWLEIVKYSYRQEIECVQKAYFTLSQSATAMEETKGRRVEYFRNCFFVDFPGRFSHGAADFMRRLSLIEAGGIELVKLEITPRGQDLAFNLNIGVTAGNTSRARGIFSRFYQSLNDLEGIMQINYTNMKPTSPANASTSASLRGNVKEFFKIDGVIELE